MSEGEFKLLFKSLGEQFLEQQPQQNDLLKSLMRETLKFRDKLKEETGDILSIKDTQEALAALESHINGEKFPRNLTPEQKALAQILIDRVILFKIQ